MTDRQHPPPRAGSHGSATSYHPHDPGPTGEPQEEKKLKIPVNVVQVGASAGAAVTSAVAASYFGVGGTLAGAAFGSVVSTVAGAIYTESLTKAHKVVATTTAVVVQRYPGDVPQADSIHRMTGPAGVPVADSLNRVGGEDTRHTEVEHVEVPIVDETQVMGRYDDTRVMPPATGATAYQPQSHPPYGQPTRQHQANGGPPTRRSERRTAEAEQSWWKRPGFLMAGISMAGFLVALAFILGTETAIGRPISGGESGNTLTRLTNADTGSTDDEDKGADEDSTPTPTPTETPAETATPTETPVPSGTDDQNAVPSVSATPESPQASEPSSADTAPDAGTEQVPPTDQPLNEDGTSQDGGEGQMQEQVDP